MIIMAHGSTSSLLRAKVIIKRAVIYMIPLMFNIIKQDRNNLKLLLDRITSLISAREMIYDYE